MTIRRINGILLLTVILFGQCTSQYEKGEREFKLENYDEAKVIYQAIKHGDIDYDKAQLRISEIDSISEKKTFDRAVSLFNEQMYSDAETFLFRIDSTSRLFSESRIYLKRIDSIRIARRLENEKREKERKIEEEKIAKLKELEDEKNLKIVKQKVRTLFNELLAFKDKSDFKYYGFGVGYKYNKWLTDVQALKNTPEAKLLLGHGFVVGDLEMLGLEYVSSKGAETEYSRWAKKTISNGLKK